MWLLLALLIAGAASYTHGSRYAIVPGYGQAQEAGGQGFGGVPPQAPTVAGPAEASVSASQAVRAVHVAGPFVEPQNLEGDCCEPNKAPRGEPAPVRTGAVDRPSVAHPDPGGETLSSIVPPEPELPALTVVDLSISRT